MINNFSGMVDYIKIQNDFTISVGGNYSNTKQIMIQNYNLQKNLTPTNYNITDTPNHFIYTENIYAVYVTFDKNSLINSVERLEPVMR